MLVAAALLTVVSNPISVEIKPQKAVFKTSENVNIDVFAINRSKQSFTVVPNMDGSETGWRGPAGMFFVKAKNGKWEPLQFKIGRCGNTNPIVAENFVKVLPGQKTALLKNMGWMPGTSYSQLGKPGVYQVKFVYDTTIPYDRWIGGPLPDDVQRETMAKFKGQYESVPKGKFESNVVTVRVTS